MTRPQRQSRIHQPSRRRVWVIAAGVLVVLVLASCAAGPNTASSGGVDVAGFWQGLWHGLISPVTFVVSLFNDKVGIYEVHNNGGWYNAGFMGGVSTVFSASGRGAVRSRRR